DVEACLRFGLLAQRGSLTLNHCDILNGTWATCLSGSKLWFVYQGNWDSDIQKRFAREGTGWMPHAAMKMIFLEPGDTLIMCPGRAIIHSVATLDHCIMAGGMIWSEHDMCALMDNICWIMTSENGTNEQIPRQFPELLDTLMEMANDDDLWGDGRESFTIQDKSSIQRLIDTLRPILSCEQQCRGSCKRGCPCATATPIRHAGCTTWCHS
ncbi:hypothetical protein EK21DRAFT_19204, partial [Setomelanomma holmii]